MRRLFRIPAIFHRALRRAVDHDCFNLAQSAAYSAMVSLFPALIVAAAVIAFLPDTAPIRSQLGAFFDRVLPPDVTPLLESYFITSPHSPKSTHALMLALLVSVTGASSVIATFMEGLRRAHNLPQNCWTFWRRRSRAYALVPLSLVPLAIASLLIVFGHIITAWIAMHVIPSVRTPVYIIALLIRWTIALTGSVGLIALIYHMGTPLQQSWKRTLPGAITATVMWFLTTLAFGWYVTRFANYSQVYGSLGAGIALLFWLYIISLSILCGAEFNYEFHAHFHGGFLPPVHPHSTDSTPHTPTHG
ncbi:MAG TPA: YihY/virulence factor BrkB family protein [Edaphobacter sp.]|nr:YihY/virulence factor BrkB family protein [Edaphobacter sp.]